MSQEDEFAYLNNLSSEELAEIAGVALDNAHKQSTDVENLPIAQNDENDEFAYLNNKSKDELKRIAGLHPDENRDVGVGERIASIGKQILNKSKTLPREIAKSFDMGYGQNPLITQYRNPEKVAKHTAYINKKEQPVIEDPLGRAIADSVNMGVDFFASPTGKVKAGLAIAGKAASKIGQTFIKETAKQAAKQAGVGAAMGAASAGLKEVGVNDTAANLIPVGAAITPTAVRAVGHLLKKIAAKYGDKAALNYIQTLNTNLVNNGSKPIEIDLGGLNPSGGKVGAANKHSRVAEKHNRFEEIIKGKSPSEPLSEYFDNNGFREAAKVEVNGKLVREAGSYIPYEEVKKALNDPKKLDTLKRFFGSLENVQQQRSAVRSLMHEMSPTGDYIDIAVAFKQRPTEIQKFLLEKMPKTERNQISAATGFVNKTAERLRNEQSHVLSNNNNSTTDIVKELGNIAGGETIAHLLGVPPFAYTAGKKIFKVGKNIANNIANNTKIGNKLSQTLSPRHRFDFSSNQILPPWMVGTKERINSPAEEIKEALKTSKYSNNPQKLHVDLPERKAYWKDETTTPKQSQTKTKPSEDTSKKSHESATNEKPSNQLVIHKDQISHPSNETVINQMVEEVDFIKKHTNPNTVSLKQFRNKYLKMGASPEEIAIAEDILKAHKKSYNIKNKPKNRMTESDIAKHSGGADNTYLAGVHTGEVGEFPGAVWKWPERKPPYELVDNYQHLLSKPVNLRKTAVEKRSEYKPTPESLAFLDDFIKSKKLKFRTGGKVSNTIPNKHLAVFLSQFSKMPHKMHARR